MKDTCFHGIGPDGDCEMCRDIITAIRPSDRSPSPSPDASLLEARSLVARLAAAETRAERAEATVAKYKTALDAINVVRNSIVGLQRFGFSEHAYPLVAALDKAGIEGMPYDTARPHFEGLLGRALEAEATAKSLTAERDYLRAREAWLRRYAQAEVDDIEQVHEWLAANPEPQPPEGCAP